MSARRTSFQCAGSARHARPCLYSPSAARSATRAPRPFASGRGADSLSEPRQALPFHPSPHPRRTRLVMRRSTPERRVPASRFVSAACNRPASSMARISSPRHPLSGPVAAPGAPVRRTRRPHPDNFGSQAPTSPGGWRRAGAGKVQRQENPASLRRRPILSASRLHRKRASVRRDSSVAQAIPSRSASLRRVACFRAAAGRRPGSPAAGCSVGSRETVILRANGASRPILRLVPPTRPASANPTRTRDDATTPRIFSRAAARLPRCAGSTRPAPQG